jgi:hypothetical protein
MSSILSKRKDTLTITFMQNSSFGFISVQCRKLLVVVGKFFYPSGFHLRCELWLVEITLLEILYIDL